MNNLDIAVQNFKMAIEKKSYIGGGKKSVLNYMANQRMKNEKYIKDKWSGKIPLYTK